jgi:hypothetical protein
MSTIVASLIAGPLILFIVTYVVISIAILATSSNSFRAKCYYLPTYYSKAKATPTPLATRLTAAISPTKIIAMSCRDPLLSPDFAHRFGECKRQLPTWTIRIYCDAEAANTSYPEAVQIFRVHDEQEHTDNVVRSWNMLAFSDAGGATCVTHDISSQITPHLAQAIDKWYDCKNTYPYFRFSSTSKTADSFWPDSEFSSWGKSGDQNTIDLVSKSMNEEGADKVFAYFHILPKALREGLLTVIKGKKQTKMRLWPRAFVPKGCREKIIHA